MGLTHEIVQAYQSDRQFLGKSPEVDDVFDADQLLEKGQWETDFLLDHQDPLTGNFPAAARHKRSIAGEYEASWTRDNANIGGALVSNETLDTFPLSTATGQRIAVSTRFALQQSLKRYTEEPYLSTFQGKEVSITDTSGNTFVIKHAPIHYDTSGIYRRWELGDQPDSFGKELSYLAQALNRGVITNLSEKEYEGMLNVGRYLIDNKIHTKTSFVPMWEQKQWVSGEKQNGAVRPPPISSIALVSQGLSDIAPRFSKEEQEKIRKIVQESETIVLRHYPHEVASEFDYDGDTNLSTGVALVEGAIPYVDPLIWITEAHRKLGSEETPGLIRFWHDPYHIDMSSREGMNRESFWIMGILIKSILYFRAWEQVYQDNPELAGVLKRNGFFELKKALALEKQYGFQPELVKQTGNGYELPPEEWQNDLLWNHAYTHRMVLGARRVLRLEKGLPLAA